MNNGTKMKYALLAIDMQNDFCLPKAASEIPGTFDIVPKIKEILERFREYEFPIIHVVRIYKPDGSNVDLCRRELIRKGAKIVLPDSEGSQIVRDLLPDKTIKLSAEDLMKGKFQEIGKKEWIMYKPRWGAFYRTSLEAKLKKLAAGTLIICGCNFPNCSRATIYEAGERDYEIIFVKDATSGIYQKGIDELRSIGVRVVEARELVNDLSKI